MKYDWFCLFSCTIILLSLPFAVYIILFIASIIAEKFCCTNFFFYSLTTEDGLPTNKVYNLLQDPQGYIWAATDNGVVKYNSEQFVRIPTDVSVKQSFTNFKMTSDGQIWCMGFPANIFYVEKDTLRFLADFAAKANNYPQISIDNPDILSVACDSGTWFFDTKAHRWLDTLQYNNQFRSKYYLHTNKANV